MSFWFPQNPECRAVCRTRSLLVPGVSQSSLHPQGVKQSDCQIRPDEEIGIGIGQRTADVGVEMLQCAWLTFLQPLASSCFRAQPIMFSTLRACCWT
jgi:hypothetical protein